MKKIYFLFVFYFISLITLSSQNEYADPVKFPIYLSGNLGELRNNHFHAGIDIKTQGVVNKPVYSVADGYISRVFVAPGGYGKALYITHPETGQVSVYGHLNSFTSEVEKYVKEKQYEKESFRVNLFPEEGCFKVKKGDLIAYSGNAGSSGGPHLHLEIRDAVTEEVIDPLNYYKQSIKDNVAPEFRGVAIYPVEGEGAVNNSRRPLRQNITKAKNGQYTSPKTAITAWGRIGLGIKAYDRMTGTQNIYGVKKISLYVDGNLIFKSVIDKFGFDQTRMLNTFIDFADWRNNKSFYMKSFIEPGNTLPFYESVDNGYININEERVYRIKYELEDAYGNKSQYSFSITGKRQAIPAPKKGSLYMVWDHDNRYLSDAFSLVIPVGNLYDNFMFTLQRTPSDVYLSDIYRVNDEPVPFHDKAEMKIKIVKDSYSDKEKYGIVSIKGNKDSWVGGTYDDGYMKANIRETGGSYAVIYDDVPPVITPVQPEIWEKQQKISIRAVDDKSGISSFRGTIDGEYALFERDIKTTIYTYHFDSSRLEKGKKHSLEFTVTDDRGNESVYTSQFYY